MSVKAREQGSNERERGFIAIAAIAFAGLIMAMSIELVSFVKLHNMLAAMTAHGAGAIADGIARLTAWRLARGDPIVLDGTFDHCRWRDDAMVEVGVQDAGGLVDLNLATEPLLKSIFEGLGENESAAKNIAQALIDYRDPDSTSIGGGPEAGAARGGRMKNGPFEAPEEIEAAVAMKEETYRRAKPLFTVHGFQAAIDPETASPELRQIMGEASSGPFTGKLAPYSGVSQKRVAHVAVRVALRSGQVFERLATVNILRQPDRPFSILTWDEGPGEGDHLLPGKGLKPCFTE